MDWTPHIKFGNRFVQKRHRNNNKVIFKEVTPRTFKNIQTTKPDLKNPTLRSLADWSESFGPESVDQIMNTTFVSITGQQAMKCWNKENGAKPQEDKTPYIEPAHVYTEEELDVWTKAELLEAFPDSGNGRHGKPRIIAAILKAQEEETKEEEGGAE